MPKIPDFFQPKPKPRRVADPDENEDENEIVVVGVTHNGISNSASPQPSVALSLTREEKKENSKDHNETRLPPPTTRQQNQQTLVTRFVSLKPVQGASTSRPMTDDAIQGQCRGCDEMISTKEPLFICNDCSRTCCKKCWALKHCCTNGISQESIGRVALRRIFLNDVDEVYRGPVADLAARIQQAELYRGSPECAMALEFLRTGGGPGSMPNEKARDIQKQLVAKVSARHNGAHVPDQEPGRICSPPFCHEANYPPVETTGSITNRENLARTMHSFGRAQLLSAGLDPKKHSPADACTLSPITDGMPYNDGADTEGPNKFKVPGPKCAADVPDALAAQSRVSGSGNYLCKTIWGDQPRIKRNSGCKSMSFEYESAEFRVVLDPKNNKGWVELPVTHFSQGAIVWKPDSIDQSQFAFIVAQSYYLGVDRDDVLKVLPSGITDYHAICQKGGIVSGKQATKAAKMAKGEYEPETEEEREKLERIRARQVASGEMSTKAAKMAKGEYEPETEEEREKLERIRARQVASGEMSTLAAKMAKGEYEPETEEEREKLERRRAPQVAFGGMAILAAKMAKGEYEPKTEEEREKLERRRAPQVAFGEMSTKAAKMAKGEYEPETEEEREKLERIRARQVASGEMSTLAAKMAKGEYEPETEEEREKLAKRRTDLNAVAEAGRDSQKRHRASILGGFDADDSNHPINKKEQKSARAIGLNLLQQRELTIRLKAHYPRQMDHAAARETVIEPFLNEQGLEGVEISNGQLRDMVYSVSKDLGLIHQARILQLRQEIYSTKRCGLLALTQDEYEDLIPRVSAATEGMTTGAAVSAFFTGLGYIWDGELNPIRQAIHGYRKKEQQRHKKAKDDD